MQRERALDGLVADGLVEPLSRGRYRLPVVEVDERYTSVEAQSQGARDLDAASAALILEQFFREHP